MTHFANKKPALLLMLGMILLLTACGSGDDADEPTTTQDAYDIQFMLPDGWRDDRVSDVGMEVGGGFGFGSPDYEGLTYLRLHQGEGFAVLGSLGSGERRRSDLLETSFARNISEPEAITVLGVEGTYATGLIDQGQAIGAVHVIVEENDEARQYGFVGVIADDWEKFEPTFLSIIDSITFKDSES